MRLEFEDFLPAVRSLREAGVRFLTMSAVLLPSGEVELSYFFEKGDQVTSLAIVSQERSVPSLFSFYGAADFPEREAARTFGLKFVGHPNLPRVRDDG